VEDLGENDRELSEDRRKSITTGVTEVHGGNSVAPVVNGVSRSIALTGPNAGSGPEAALLFAGMSRRYNVPFVLFWSFPRES
jgi:hypothetical protein